MVGVEGMAHVVMINIQALNADLETLRSAKSVCDYSENQCDHPHYIQLG